MWVQGSGGYSTAASPITVSLTTNAGDCLMCSVAMVITGNPIFWQCQAAVSDTQGNIWLLVATSPVQGYDNGTTVVSQVWTFAALNIKSGATVITVDCSGAQNAVTIDEYSGVAPTSAIDALSFNSTAYFSGLSSVDSLSIPVNGTEMVYSVGFADTASETLTPTSGFNTRQTQTGTNATIVSFDELFTGGTADNVVTASTTPGSLHVIIIALSSTPVPSPILQIGWGVNEGTIDLTVTGAYPYPNTAGNLLILVSRVYERSDYTVADTQGNTWVVLPFPDNSPADLVMAYCLNAKAGANTVTLTGNTGGDDVSFTMILAEYKIQGAVFLSSSWGQNQPGGSVNTGNVAADVGDILISALWLGANGYGANNNQSTVPPVGSSPGTWRYQFASTGLFNSAPAAVVLADQIAPSSGNYSNTFTPNTSRDSLVAAILGFQLPDVISLACPINNGGQIGQFYSGQLIVTGGVAPFTFSIISGSLPPGLSLNSMTGLISGTPTTAGSYPYEAQVTDSLGNVATANCIITIPNSGLSSSAMASCGCLPSVEVTRDIDADWGDQDTFYITQDQPFPFTLRGIVLRMSYEND